VSADSPSVTHQVVVGVLVRDGRVLLCHRRADRSWYPDVWDFPGGHVEDGESALTALARELREELGVDARGLGQQLARWVDLEASEDISFLAVPQWTGEVTNLALEEHDEIRWVTLDEAVGLRLADPRYVPLITGLLATSG
jgi:mutator protein MutT